MLYERFRGHLNALEFIPAVPMDRVDEVSHYQLAASVLNNQLCSLYIHDKLPMVDINFVNLEHFKNLRYLKFQRGRLSRHI
jgi:hypothetical protein